MKDIATFIAAGWDFTDEIANGTEDIWKISDDGTSYPKLSWEPVVYPFGNIPGQKNIKLTLNDSHGVPVTFSLTGGGYGELTGEGNFDRITLYDTGDKSQLTISTKSKTYTSVGDIVCNQTLKGITAKTATLHGDITINGTSANPKAAVAITFDKGEGLNINSEMPIKSISATDWWWFSDCPVGRQYHYQE